MKTAPRSTNPNKFNEFICLCFARLGQRTAPPFRNSIPLPHQPTQLTSFVVLIACFHSIDCFIPFLFLLLHSFVGFVCLGLSSLGGAMGPGPAHNPPKRQPNQTQLHELRSSSLFHQPTNQRVKLVCVG